MGDGLLRPDWGVCPVLLRIGPVPVPAYEVLVLLGLAATAALYARAAGKSGTPQEHALPLFMAAMAGGVLGAKLPVWALHWREIAAAGTPLALLPGRTVVGGLIGGTLAVIAARRRLGIAERTGNLFAPAAALGLAIGRIGCFCRGCCHGVATSLPWGVDFGDGIRRHPTQLYEGLFLLALFALLQAASQRQPAPGALFRWLMLGYFGFRFAIEFLRTDPPALAGLTLAQAAAAGVVGYYLATSHRKGG